MIVFADRSPERDLNAYSLVKASSVPPSCPIHVYSDLSDSITSHPFTPSCLDGVPSTFFTPSFPLLDLGGEFSQIFVIDRLILGFRANSIEARREDPERSQRRRCIATIGIFKITSNLIRPSLFRLLWILLIWYHRELIKQGIFNPTQETVVDSGTYTEKG